MSISAEDKLQYVFTVLKHTELAQPNYGAVAKECGINNANNAQKKFKAYVEQAGFKLVNKQIINEDDNADSPKVAKSATPSTPAKKTSATATKSAKKTPAKKTPAANVKKEKVDDNRSAKKRKVEEIIDVSDDELAQTSDDTGSDQVKEEVKEEQDEQMGDVDGEVERGYQSDSGRSMTLQNEDEI